MLPRRVFVHRGGCAVRLLWGGFAISPGNEVACRSLWFNTTVRIAARAQGAVSTSAYFRPSIYRKLTPDCPDYSPGLNFKTGGAGARWAHSWHASLQRVTVASLKSLIGKYLKSSYRNFKHFKNRHKLSNRNFKHFKNHQIVTLSTLKIVINFQIVTLSTLKIFKS